MIAMNSLTFKQKLNLYAVYHNNISQENGKNTLTLILIRPHIAGREVTHAFQKKVILNIVQKEVVRFSRIKNLIIYTL